MSLGGGNGVWSSVLSFSFLLGAKMTPATDFLLYNSILENAQGWLPHGRLVGGHFRGAKLLSSGFNIGKPTVDTYLSCLLNMSFLDNKDRILNSRCHSLFPISHNIFFQRYRPKSIFSPPSLKKRLVVEC